VPLLNVDMWEHSYYVDYENRKKEYLEKIWRIIDWEAAEERFKMKYVAQKIDPD
jgi:Fe-Mn family superoxide dismutase